MATTTANIVGSLSAGSGVDIKALAQNLVDAEKAPRADIIQKRIDQSNAKISGYGAISYALDSLRTAFDGLRDVSDFSSIAASNSQPSAFGVIAGPTAGTGVYDVNVTQVATGQRSVSAGSFAASSTALNGGAAMSLTLNVAGSDHAIAVAAGKDTPAGIVVAINEAALGVSAQLINTGIGYRVVLSGTEGAANTFALSVGQGDFGGTYADSTASLNSGQAMSLTLTDTSVSPASTTNISVAAGSDSLDGIIAAINTAMGANYASKGGSAGAETLILPAGINLKDITGFALSDTPLQAAQDAAFTVNGLSVTRASNEVSDVVTGVTFNLYASTSGSARVDLSRNTADVKTKLQNLVTSYNDFSDTLDVLGDPKSTVDTFGGALVGESFLYTVRNQVRSMITANADTATGTIDAFRDIGITFDRYGKMSFDEGTFDSAATSHYDDIVTMMTADTEAQSLYSAAPAGAAGAAYKALDGMLGLNGIIARRTTNAQADVTAQEERMTALEDQMSRILDRYLQQFAAMDAIVGSMKSMGDGLTSTFDGMMAMYTKK